MRTGENNTVIVTQTKPLKSYSEKSLRSIRDSKRISKLITISVLGMKVIKKKSKEINGYYNSKHPYGYKLLNPDGSWARSPFQHNEGGLFGWGWYIKQESVWFYAPNYAEGSREFSMWLIDILESIGCSVQIHIGNNIESYGNQAGASDKHSNWCSIVYKDSKGKIHDVEAYTSKEVGWQMAVCRAVLLIAKSSNEISKKIKETKWWD